MERTARAEHGIAVADRRDVERAVGEARRCARRAGFGAPDAEIVATAASELATNILRYAGTGRFVARTVREVDRTGVLIEARDRGPGIADVAAALSPGYSTGGGLGLGLPAVARAMDSLTVDARPGSGTRVLGLRWRRRPSGELRQLCGLAARPLIDAGRCGDALLVLEERERRHAAVIDVLGHGAEARRLADELLERLRSADWSDLPGLIAGVDAAVKGSRGAALGVTSVPVEGGTVTHAGIGNTVTIVAGERRTQFPERSGVVGGLMPAPHLFTAPAAPGDLVVGWTDGIRSRAVPAVLARHADAPPQALAETIVERCARGTDDAACVVLRVAP